MEKLKILFLGTPKFAVSALEALIKTQYSILGVITAPDTPIGRKQVLTAPAVKIAAQKLSLPVYQPGNKTELANLLKNLRPELAVVAAFGMIFPEEILKIPKYGFLNIHASLLPRWRGPSPIQAAILNGDKETGVTIIRINEKMDEGPIIAARHLSFASRRITAEELSEKLAKLGADLLVEILPKYLKGEIKPREQNQQEATYCKIIKKEDGLIDWKNPAEFIERQTRAYMPWPGAFTKLRIRDEELKILKIIEAEVIEENNHKIGEIFLTKNKKLAVKCSENSLILKVIQIEGKKPMSGEEFLRGHQYIINSTLAPTLEE